MPKSQDIPWKRLFAEGLAIIVSILLAFGIDAWWEGREQKHYETVLLQAILDDLIEKKSKIARDIKYNQAILESARTLVNAAAAPQQNLDNGDIDRHIGFTWWYNDPSVWDSAPMNSLITGGDLSSISNPELLQELSTLQLSLGGLKTVYANDQRFHNDVLIPFFIANVNLPQIANITKHSPGDPENRYVFPDFAISTQYNHAELVSKVEFQSLLVAKIDKVVDISRQFDGLDKALNESIELIRAELAK
jgi:hypothetical protein